jgi:hypothetical protein
LHYMYSRLFVIQALVHLWADDIAFFCSTGLSLCDVVLYFLLSLIENMVVNIYRGSS